MSPSKSGAHMEPGTPARGIPVTTAPHEVTPSPPVPTDPQDQISASSRTNEILRGILGGPPPEEQATKPQLKGKKKAKTPSGGTYDKLSFMRRQEIHSMTSKFILEMKEYASHNNLNPADVMRHAFGGELKAQGMDTWKTMHWLSCAHRRGCKFFCAFLHL